LRLNRVVTTVLPFILKQIGTIVLF
jgi:hypothetical protein